MLERIKKWVQSLLSFLFRSDLHPFRVIKKGSAMRVIFFYPGEEGTYVDHAEVILYENGVVHITSHQEETTTHLQNCEILWRFETDAEERTNKVRLLKPKLDSRAAEPRGSENPSEETESKDPQEDPQENSQDKDHFS